MALHYQVYQTLPGPLSYFELHAVPLRDAKGHSHSRCCLQLDAALMQRSEQAVRACREELGGVCPLSKEDLEVEDRPRVGDEADYLLQDRLKLRAKLLVCVLFGGRVPQDQVHHTLRGVLFHAFGLRGAEERDD